MRNPILASAKIDVPMGSIWFHMRFQNKRFFSYNNVWSITPLSIKEKQCKANDLNDHRWCCVSQKEKFNALKSFSILKKFLEFCYWRHHFNQLNDHIFILLKQPTALKQKSVKTKLTLKVNTNWIQFSQHAKEHHY